MSAHQEELIALIHCRHLDPAINQETCSMLEEKELTLSLQKAQLNLKNAQLDRGPNPLLLRYLNMKYCSTITICTVRKLGQL